MLLLISRHLDHQLRGAVDHDENVIEALLFLHFPFELGNENTFANLEELLRLWQLLVHGSLRVSVEHEAQETTDRVHDGDIDTDDTHGHDAGEDVAHHTLVVEEDDEIIPKAGDLLVDEQRLIGILVLSYDRERPVESAIFGSLQLEVDIDELGWQVAILLLLRLHL